MPIIQGTVCAKGHIIEKDVSIEITRKPQEDDIGNWVATFETNAIAPTTSMALELTASNGWSGTGSITQTIVRPSTKMFVEVTGNGRYDFPLINS